MDAFFSYTGSDGDIVRELASHLESVGYVTWYYQRDSKPGLSYLEQVSAAMKECRAVAALISPRVVDSQVMHELAETLRLKKPLIPLLLDLTFAELQTDDHLGLPLAIGPRNALPITGENLVDAVPPLVAGLEQLGIFPHAPREEVDPTILGDALADLRAAMQGVLRLRGIDPGPPHSVVQTFHDHVDVLDAHRPLIRRAHDLQEKVMRAPERVVSAEVKDVAGRIHALAIPLHQALAGGAQEGARETGPQWWKLKSKEAMRVADAYVELCQSVYPALETRYLKDHIEMWSRETGETRVQMFPGDGGVEIVLRIGRSREWVERLKAVGVRARRSGSNGCAFRLEAGRPVPEVLRDMVRAAV